MKAFLFLYPIHEYIKEELHLPNKHLVMERFNEIIDKRYRQRNYQIYWLLFGLEGDPKKPDMALLDSRIKIHYVDQIISAGSSFERLKRNRLRIYPSAKKILAKIDLTNGITIGGFHQSDCVRRVAKAAYRMGVSVFVDEDTTEQYFLSIKCGWGFPPSVRTREEYSASFLWNLLRFRETSRHLADAAIKNQRVERKKSPWLVQI